MPGKPWAPTGAWRPGKLQVALSLKGVTDPPVSDEFEVKFQPKAKSALVVRKLVEQDARNKLVHKTKRQQLHLRDGVFVEGAGKR